MTDRELMQQALEALERYGGVDQRACDAEEALRERLAQPEQEFTTHEEGKDGWSDWVCPDPQSYLMKCCDCGLVHEAQFGVVRYTDTAEKENCDMVDDPNLQAVFRMRRSEQWTPKDTAYRPGGLAQPEQKQDSTCNKTLRAEGKGYPRTCRKCGKGPCIADRVQPEQEPTGKQHLQVEQPVACRVCGDKRGSWAWQCNVCGAFDESPQPRKPPAQPEQDAVLAEREACAKVCDDIAFDWNKHAAGGPVAAYNACAAAIRARGNT